MTTLSRRRLLGLGLAGCMLPLVGGSVAGNRRKFLFLYCPGGWDQLVVFCTVFNDRTTREMPAGVSEAGGIAFVDAESRPSVRGFFETWGGRTCVLNGMQVPSIAHEVCRRILFTGNNRGGRDDWASILGAAAATELPMPNVVLSGPAYPVRYGGATTRVGEAGQLPDLLDGLALGASDFAATLPDPAVEALEQSFVSRRTRAWAETAGRGRERTLAELEIQSQARAERLALSTDALRAGDVASLADRASIVSNAFELGLARSGVLAFDGYDDSGWDTHANNQFQDRHFETLFEGLLELCADLDARPGEEGGSLLDETTVVVLSEMGRLPLANGTGGKEHWTWTSAMLIGSGVAGGQCVGRWTEDIEGSPVDLASGEATGAGETLKPAHLGATLLALADLDPGEFIEESEGSPILAAMA